MNQSATRRSATSPKNCGGGVECEGYALIADKGEKTEVGIMHMSKSDIATGIAETPALLASAHIAKALREARDIEMKAMSLPDLMKKLAEK